MFSGKDGSTARGFYYSAVGWMAFGMLVGLTAALLMIWPDFIKNSVTESLRQYLTFGRLRPVHTNVVMFGWLSGAYFGTMFYMLPRLGETRVWSEKLGNFTVLWYNLTIAAHAVALMAGYNTGREYAEQPWPVKYAMAVTFLLVAVNLFMTSSRRKEHELYVTQWYMLGALIWTPIIYAIGNQFLFPTNPISGVNDAVVNWFYGHNILGYWFTPVGVGALYYLLPKMTGNPLYSHKLSMIGFWTIAFVYGPTGAHHLVNGPVPQWLQTVAIAFSVSLIIPVWTVLTNFYGTMAGKWSLVRESVPLKFAVAAASFYFITCFQGPMQALRSVSAVTHFTDWVVGHAHVALLGTFSFIMFASIYYALPRLTNRAVYSKPLQDWHFWLSFVGFSAFFISLTVGGLVKGFMWAAAEGDPTQFIDVVRAMKPYYVVRALSGAMILSAQLLFIYNIYKTATAGREIRLGETTMPQPADLLAAGGATTEA